MQRTQCCQQLNNYALDVGGSLPTLKESEVAVGKFPLVAKVTAASRTDAADVERPRPWDDAAAFVPDRSLYEPMTKGQSATDWLQNTHEEPQTFDDFREMTDTQSLSAARTAPLSVRILPIGDMTRHFATPPPDDELRTLRSFLDMFFCGRLEALVLPAADVREDLQTRSVRSSPARQAKRPKLKVEVATPPPQTPNIGAEEEEEMLHLGCCWLGPRRAKIHHRVSPALGANKHRQLSVSSLLGVLCKIRESNRFREAHSASTIMLGITHEDLFFDAAVDIFSAGYSWSSARLAVVSCARYDPLIEFSEQEWHKWTLKKCKLSPKCAAKQMLWRGLRCCAHELCHVLGMTHCVHFRCLMNGTGSVQEEDRGPTHLCCVCLRKLCYACNINPRNRYVGLLAWFRQHEWLEEERWVARWLAQYDTRLSRETCRVDRTCVRRRWRDLSRGLPRL